jgi:arginase
VGARDEPTGLLNPHSIRIFSGRLADALGGVLVRGEFPLVLGGDCSILLGCLLALRRSGSTGLLFIDGHADFYQPEAEPKGEAASMDLALATGRGPAIVTDPEGRRPLVRDEDVVVVGYRDRDDAARHGSQPLPRSIAAIDLETLRDEGAARAAERAIDLLTRPGAPERFWIHLDVDVLDDEIMPAVDYRMPGGLSWRELATVLRRAVVSDRAVGLDVAIYNPKLDPLGTAARGLVDTLVEVLE